MRRGDDPPLRVVRFPIRHRLSPLPLCATLVKEMISILPNHEQAPIRADGRYRANGNPY